VAKHFPSDFYVTCASVIPVLFLAVSLQGSAWGSLRRQTFGAADALERFGRSSPVRRIFTSVLVSTVGAALLIMFAGGVGEFFALLALFGGSEFPGQRVIVFVATLILVAAVVVTSYMTFMGTGQGFLKQVAQLEDEDNKLKDELKGADEAAES
jgi:formate hydrogenlyase subunit 3/multisubunit Na+/H+ antiporter MnhD subunit